MNISFIVKKIQKIKKKRIVQASKTSNFTQAFF